LSGTSRSSRVTPKGPSIGIPRALSFYDYYPLYREFFRGIGARVVVSRPTTQVTVERGVSLTVDDTCLPVKVFFGHVAELVESGVDYLFVPRIVSVEPRTYICPKFLGLPEMVRSSGLLRTRLLTFTVNMNRGWRGLWQALQSAARPWGAPGWRVARAFGRALKAQREHRDACEGGEWPGCAMGCSVPPRRQTSSLRVAVLGHPYIVYDRGLNLGLVDFLLQQGVDVVTPERLEESVLDAAVADLPKRLFWSPAKKVMGAFRHLLAAGGVDGVVHLVAFGCGSDALIGELVEREARRLNSMPHMMLTLDEHAAQAGVITRIEAFLDMIERRRRL